MSGKSSSRGRVARRILGTLGIGAALVGGGCSLLDLGPEPSDYVGQGNQPPMLLTDPGLHAVTPSVPGDEPGGGAALPSTSMPGEGVTPSSMPAATQPTTVSPATASGSATAPRPENTASLGQGAPQTRPAEDHPELSVQDAILMGLQNNTSLRVQRYTVPIRRTSEEQARAQFDPTVNFSLQGGANGGRDTTNTISGSASVTEFLPTGTTIEAAATTSNTFYSEANSSLGGNLTVTQSLLRGAGLDVNLASLREAVLATRVTQYQLRGFAESLVSDIEQAYWDLAFAERQVVIVQDSLDVAQKQLTDTSTRIRLGGVSPSELPAAEAELAQRRENLIDAKSTLETTRLRFMQLLAPASRAFWSQTVTLTTLPFIPTGPMDPVDKHVEVALRLRPEINETKLQLQRGDLEIVRTRNGLLPRLDLFVTLGKTGFSSAFGTTFSDLNGRDYQALLGVRGDWEPLNRAAEATYRASELSQQQLEESMNNLIQTVELDVRTQYIEVERTRQQIDATHATRIAQEANLKVQQGKLAAGNGTSLDVAIAQRDLLVTQLSEVQAVTGHLKALVALYRLEGSLLLRRGLDAPGAKPVTDVAWKK